MSWLWQIGAAVALDAVLGDPRSWPHPVRWIAALADRLKAGTLRRFENRRIAGVAAASGVYVTVVLIVLAALWSGTLLHPVLGWLAGVIVIYWSLAARDLGDHVLSVYNALAADNLPLARREVSMIVGRDVERLDRGGVAAAAIESLAESLADGVLSPLFWAFVLGPAGAACYRAVNTLDSMWGHKDAEYREFGWFAARTDDAANFIPARLSGLFLCLAGWLRGTRRTWRIWLRDCRRHASPNAGHPEAAMAGALGARLGGLAYYDGEPHDRPVLNGEARPPETADVLTALGLAAVAYALALAVGLAVSLVALGAGGSGHVY